MTHIKYGMDNYMYDVSLPDVFGKLFPFLQKNKNNENNFQKIRVILEQCHVGVFQ